MVNNVSTNPGALLALQTLNRVTERLEETQRRVSTGLEVSSATDNPVLFSLAQKQRGELASVDSVRQGLRIGVSTVDLAIAASESISDILVEMRTIASEAADSSIDAATRTLLQNEYVELANQITRTIDSAAVGGRNLISAGAGDLVVTAGIDGTSTITVAAQDLTIGAGIIDISGDGLDLATAAGATTEIADVDAAIDALSTAIASFASGADSLDLQDKILTRVSDALELSIGNLVDADLARESSRLQALQVQQQLAIQTLSIANAAPNAILALFA